MWLLGGLLTLALAALLDLPLRLGAHPFWADQVVLIGAGLGTALALLVRKRRAPPLAFGLIIGAVAAIAAAHWGKTAFAASFAENALAGRVWYGGWIATMTLACAAVSTAVRAWVGR